MTTFFLMSDAISQTSNNSTSSDPFWAILGILISGLSGGFGGIIASINGNKENVIIIKGEPKRIGFWGDFLTGVGAGMAALTLLTPISGGTDGLDATDVPRLVGIGILAGIGGSKLLTSMTASIFKDLKDKQEVLATKVNNFEKLNELIIEGERALLTEPKLAEELFLKALKIESRHHLASLDLAKAYKNQAIVQNVPEKSKELLHKAINCLNIAIEVSSNYDRAYYNRACYKALAGYSLNDILKDLKTAITLFPGNKEHAARDIDFISIQNDPSFLNLLS